MNELLIETLPYLIPIVAILITALLAKYKINVSKEMVIGLINKLVDIFMNVEDTHIKGNSIPKLEHATDMASIVLNNKEKKILRSIGYKAEMDSNKPTFGDNLIAGVHDIFTNTAMNLLSHGVTKAVKKITK